MAEVSESMLLTVSTQAGQRRPAAVDCTQYIDSWNRQQNGNIIVLSERYVQFSKPFTLTTKRGQHVASYTAACYTARCSSPVTESHRATQRSHACAALSHSKNIHVSSRSSTQHRQWAATASGGNMSRHSVVRTIYFYLSCVQCVWFKIVC